MTNKRRQMETTMQETGENVMQIVENYKNVSVGFFSRPKHFLRIHF